MLAWLFPAIPPVIFPVTTAAGHVYVVGVGTSVFGGVLIGFIVNDVLLQIV
jgi:hypothetical protein